MQDQTRNIIILVIFSMLLMVILTAFIISIYFQYQKRQILFFNNIDQLKLEYEKNLLTAQLEIQENTLLNISQEIHDNIGLTLTLAKLNLNSIEVFDTRKLEDLLGHTKELLTKSITDLSDLSKSFNAEVIMNQGFLTSIEHEILRIKKLLCYNVEYQINGDPYFIDSRTEILLFRIFQESLNNILKHANAKKVQILLSYEKDQFVLSISDDGIGFDLTNVMSQKKSRAGIKNIKRRAELIFGKVTIDSKENIGTTICITTPIKPNLNDK